MTQDSKDELEEQLIISFDNILLSLMHFTKKQVLAESIHNTVLTPPQFGLLWCLNCAHTLTMTELADKLDLSHGAATGLVDRLDKLNLIKRERSEDDRRVVYVTLSDAGQQLIKRVNSKRHAILGTILQDLTPQERQTLLKIDMILKDKLEHHV